MSRRTLNSLAFPNDVDDPQLPIEWALGASVQITRWVWQSYERLVNGALRDFDFDQRIEQVERGLTQLHFIDLQAVYCQETQGYSSLIPVHEYDEFESLSSPAAKPPSYDFAFVHFVHRRWAWPIEAKVLRSPRDLAGYMSDVSGKFETGIAAPLVGEGGMIGYLLGGPTLDALRELETRLGQTLGDYPELARPSHKISLHERQPSPRLRLHHMILRMRH